MLPVEMSANALEYLVIEKSVTLQFGAAVMHAFPNRGKNLVIRWRFAPDGHFWREFPSAIGEYFMPTDWVALFSAEKYFPRTWLPRK